MNKTDHATQLADLGALIVHDKSQKKDLEKGHAVLKAMLADGEKLLDRKVLLGHLRAFGLARNNWAGLSAYQDWYNVSDVGPLQVPTELVDYLLYTARTKPRSIAEIGVFTGGTALFSCAFFQALDPQVEYHCIDIKDTFLVLPETKEMLNLFPHMNLSSDVFADQSFDVVFIDGDHSYMWAKRDYLNLGRNARKICAFHDINAKEYNARGGGIYQFWRQLRMSVAPEHTMVEISHAPINVGFEKDGCWMGIGIIDYTT